MKKPTLTIFFFLISVRGFSPASQYPYKDTTMIELHFKDKIVKATLSTLKTIESNGDYMAKGGSGEFGAYQFTQCTWNLCCMRYFKQEFDITIPSNQDKVAYARVFHLIEQGFTVKEVASIWNCGSPTWKGKTGINKYSIPYNVPVYVDRFYTILSNEFKVRHIPTFEFITPKSTSPFYIYSHFIGN